MEFHVFQTNYTKIHTILEGETNIFKTFLREFAKAIHKKCCYKTITISINATNKDEKKRNVFSMTHMVNASLSVDARIIDHTFIDVILTEVSAIP